MSSLLPPRPTQGASLLSDPLRMFAVSCGVGAGMVMLVAMAFVRFRGAPGPDDPTAQRKSAHRSVRLSEDARGGQASMAAGVAGASAAMGNAAAMTLPEIAAGTGGSSARSVQAHWVDEDIIAAITRDLNLTATQQEVLAQLLARARTLRRPLSEAFDQFVPFLMSDQAVGFEFLRPTLEP